MKKEKTINRKTTNQRILNGFNLLTSIFIFGTGLILLFLFHMGGSPYRIKWLGLEKNVWLLIHQISAIAFLIGFTWHIQMHWKYVRAVFKRWRQKLPQKNKSRTRFQIIFLIVAAIVLWAGFYPWITMPNATLQVERYHHWIDIHNQVGLWFFIGMIVHIFKRWRRIFRFTKGA